MKEIYNNLPQKIKTLLLISEGWLVGSAPEKLLNSEIPKDYDIIVPSRELFQLTCCLFKNEKIDINTFGGIKIQINDLLIDIWCEELGHFIMTSTGCNYAFNLKRSKLFKNVL